MNITYVADERTYDAQFVDRLVKMGHTVNPAIFLDAPSDDKFRKMFEEVDTELIIGVGTLAIPVLNMTGYMKILINPEERVTDKSYTHDLQALNDLEERMLTEIMYQKDSTFMDHIRVAYLSSVTKTNDIETGFDKALAKLQENTRVLDKFVRNSPYGSNI